MAMEPEKAIKGYKAENVKLQKTIDDYAKTVGQLTVLSKIKINLYSK